jgi:hypothetical protein
VAAFEALSDSRTVISVWNQGRGKESAIPWTVFHDGVERTEVVRELPEPFSDRPDIRIGVLDLATTMDRGLGLGNQKAKDR